MRIIFAIMATVLATVLSIAFTATTDAAETLTAEQVIEKAWSKFRHATTEKETIETTVQYKDGRQEKKSLVRYTKYDKSHNDKVIIKFTGPSTDKGLGLYIQRQADGDDQYWLKLASMTNTRKIPVADQSKYFGGLDLTYEDNRLLLGETTSNFNYSYASNNLGKIIITAKPKTRAVSDYGKRDIHLDKNFAITSIVYYDQNGQVIKRQLNEQLQVIQNGSWRPGVIIINNERLKRTTILEIKDRQINQKLTDSIFSKNYLLSENY